MAGAVLALLTKLSKGEGKRHTFGTAGQDKALHSSSARGGVCLARSW